MREFTGKYCSFSVWHARWLMRAPVEPSSMKMRIENFWPFGAMAMTTAVGSSTFARDMNFDVCDSIGQSCGAELVWLLMTAFDECACDMTFVPSLIDVEICEAPFMRSLTIAVDEFACAIPFVPSGCNGETCEAKFIWLVETTAAVPCELVFLFAFVVWMSVWWRSPHVRQFRTLGQAATKCVELRQLKQNRNFSTWAIRSVTFILRNVGHWRKLWLSEHK